MRMIINESKKDYKKNLDYIIIVKKPFISYSYQEMKEDYEKAIKSINS
jgi:ribonuclease P protein component